MTEKIGSLRICSSSFCKFVDLERRMPWNLQTAMHERLDPRNTLTPPTVPIRRQPVLSQVFPIHCPQDCIKDIWKAFDHWGNGIRQVSATVPAERPRSLRRAAEKPQRRTGRFRRSCLQRFQSGTPRSVVGVDLGGGRVGRRGWAQGDGHHFCRDTDP